MKTRFLIYLIASLILAPALSAQSQRPEEVSDSVKASKEVTFPSQVQLGNIFTEGEKVGIKAAFASAKSVEWQVTDYEKQVVDKGAAAVSGGELTIHPAIKAIGYYVVTFTPKDGAAAGEPMDTTCAIVPKFDLGKLAGSRFGVMTHFASSMPTDVLPLMAKGGMSWIRDEQFWKGIEKEKGKYEFPEAYTAYMEQAKALNINVLFDASFGNPLYDNQPKVPDHKLAPYTDEGRQGYANYVAAVLEKYGTQLTTAEIWNEYNGTFCAGEAAKDRPKYYTEMLKVSYEKIKATRPGVTVLGAAAVKIPLPYLEKLFKLGALDYMDAIAVHPYQGSPEGVEKNLQELVELTKKYNHGKSKPIWATECGYSKDKSRDRGDAASHMVRIMTLQLTVPEVERVFWYLARDFREFPVMGLVRGDADPMGKFVPVLTYSVYANMVRLFDGAEFTRRVETDPRTRVYQFDKAGETFWVCWSTVRETELNFPSSSPLLRVNMAGGVRELAPKDGVVRVPVGAEPFYVVAKRGAVGQVKETRRPDQLIADSEDQFSGEQGKHGWQYLYYASNKDGSAPYLPEQAVPMEWKPSPGDWDDVWSGPGRWFILGAGGGQPAGVKGGQGWTVLRWTADRDGEIKVSTRVSRGDTRGDGVGVKIFHEGKELASQLVKPGATEVVEVTPTVKKGQILDFISTPGPGTDNSYDGIGYRVSILVPTP